MLRFRLALIAYSARLILPLAIVVLAIACASYIGAIPLNEPPDPDCPSPNLLIYCVAAHPSRYAWQVPVALAIGVIGVGSALVIAMWNKRHPRARPLPPLPAGWQ